MNYNLPDVPMLHMTSRGEEIKDGDTIHIVAIRFELDVQNKKKHTAEKYVEDYKVTAHLVGDELQFLYNGATDDYDETKRNELSDKYEAQGLTYVCSISPASYLWRDLVENCKYDLFSIDISKIITT